MAITWGNKTLSQNKLNLSIPWKKALSQQLPVKLVDFCGELHVKKHNKEECLPESILKKINCRCLLW